MDVEEENHFQNRLLKRFYYFITLGTINQQNGSLTQIFKTLWYWFNTDLSKTILF